MINYLPNHVSTDIINYDDGNIRVLLHNYIYNDQNNIEMIIQGFCDLLDIIKLQYNNFNRSIILSINSDIYHNKSWFYNLTDSAMRKFLIKTVPSINCTEEEKIYKDMINNLLNTESKLSRLYNLAIISNNCIVIYL